MKRQEWKKHRHIGNRELRRNGEAFFKDEVASSKEAAAVFQATTCVAANGFHPQVLLNMCDEMYGQFVRMLEKCFR